MPHRPASLSAIGPPALKLFVLLLALYLLTFKGGFEAIDELALYTLSESLVQVGDFSRTQLAFTPFHAPVGALEPGLPLVAAPLYWLARQFQSVNNIHVVMLLNPALTAATAALIYLITRRLGYSHAAALVAALGYGVATLAWPYARTLYREPLVAFGWSAAFLSLLEWRLQGKPLWALLAVALLALTVLVKVTAVVAIPFLLLLALFDDDGRLDARTLALAGALLTVGAAFFLLVFSLRFEGLEPLTRFVRWSPATSLLRIYGQLLSPGKGLLFYMPAALLFPLGALAIVSAPREEVARGAGPSPTGWPLALATVGPLLALAVAYSGYSAWYGGLSWGPRFLVPGLPLAMVSIAALWDSLDSAPGRVGLFAVLACSALVQFPVAVSPWRASYEPLLRSGPNPEDVAGLNPANLALSPPLVMLQRWSPDTLNLIWLHSDPQAGTVFLPRLALLLLLSLVAALLFWAVRADRLPRRPLYLLGLLPVLVAAAALPFLGAAGVPPSPGLPAATAHRLAEWAHRYDPRPYTVVTVSNAFHLYPYAGFLKGDFVHHWLSPSQHGNFAPLLEQSRGQRLALVLDRVHLPPGESGRDAEWWLNEHAYRGFSRWIDDYQVINYTLPRREAPAPRWQPVDYRFGDSFRITRFALDRSETPPDSVLRAQVEICREDAPPDDHYRHARLFMHLNAPSARIFGTDGSIRFGQLAVTGWPPGRCLLERRALHIPPDAAPGRYTLIAGFAIEDEHLPAVDARAAPPAPPADHLPLGQIVVQEAIGGHN